MFNFNKCIHNKNLYIEGVNQVKLMFIFQLFCKYWEFYEETTCKNWHCEIQKNLYITGFIGNEND